MRISHSSMRMDHDNEMHTPHKHAWRFDRSWFRIACGHTGRLAVAPSHTSCKEPPLKPSLDPLFSPPAVWQRRFSCVRNPDRAISTRLVAIVRTVHVGIIRCACAHLHSFANAGIMASGRHPIHGVHQYPPASGKSVAPFRYLLPKSHAVTASRAGCDRARNAVS